MTEQEIRTEIRQRLKDGRLPRRLNARFPRASGQAGDLGSVVMGGDQCSACDGTNPHHTYKGPSGNNVSLDELETLLATQMAAVHTLTLAHAHQLANVNR